MFFFACEKKREMTFTLLKLSPAVHCGKRVGTIDVSMCIKKTDKNRGNLKGSGSSKQVNLNLLRCKKTSIKTWQLNRPKRCERKRLTYPRKVVSKWGKWNMKVREDVERRVKSGCRRVWNWWRVWEYFRVWCYNRIPFVQHGNTHSRLENFYLCVCNTV